MPDERPRAERAVSDELGRGTYNVWYQVLIPHELHFIIFIPDHAGAACCVALSIQLVVCRKPPLALCASSCCDDSGGGMASALLAARDLNIPRQVLQVLQLVVCPVRLGQQRPRFA